MIARFVGENLIMGKNKTFYRPCKLCQKMIRVFYSRDNDGKGRFCSKNCFNNWKRKFGKGTQKSKCLQCHVEFIPKDRNRKNRVQRFCSIKCARTYRHFHHTVSPIQRRININFTQMIYRSLRGNKQRRKWKDLVGYDANILIKSIEKKFKFGMTWKNYGKEWHIDHKIPISAFNFENYNHIDFKKCWGLNNLQPLWKHDNLSKGAKLNKYFQPSLLLG